MYDGKPRKEHAANLKHRIFVILPNWTKIETWLALANVFRMGQQRKKEVISFAVHVNGMIMFLYLVEKPGEVQNGRPNVETELAKLEVDIPERWG